MNLNLLKTFSKVAELGSFTKASKVLNQPKSRVSRAISRLEAEVGVQLLRRTTRQTSLTSSGQDFFKKIHPLLIELNTEVDRISSLENEISGILRITAPEDMGQTIVAEVITVYTNLYPKVQVQAIITNEFLDLTKENIDVAFRAGKLADSNLMQRKLRDVCLIMIASKSYLQTYGKPIKISDLEKHKFLSFKNSDRFVISNKLVKNDIIKPVLRSDSFSMLLNMALNDMGITICPDYYCNSYLEKGDLVRVLPNWVGQKSGIHLVYPPSKNQSLKIKKFIEVAMDSKTL